MNMNFAKFPAPVLGGDTQELYTRLYGDAGERFLEILNTSPNEIAVISRLIVYLKARKGVEQNGSAKNCPGDRNV